MAGTGPKRIQRRVDGGFAKHGSREEASVKDEVGAIHEFISKPSIKIVE